MLYAEPASRFVYPEAKKIGHTDTYNGVTVADPYRWLEDADGADTKVWVEAENKITNAWLAEIPQREAIRKRITQLYDYERYPSAWKWGGRYFLYRNDGLQNQDVLYTTDAHGNNAVPILDPNTLRADGTAALSGVSPSGDGKLLAYSVAQAGSDWSEWRIRDIATGKDRSDLVQWTKFTHPQWTPDNSAFYYFRFPQPADSNMLTAANKNAKVYLHKLGEPQSADKLIYEDPSQPEWMFIPILTEDARYLVLHVEANDAGKNMLYYQDLTSAKHETVKLISKLTSAYNFLGCVGRTFYVHTTEGAPNGRVVAIDLDHPEPGAWKEIVKERPEPIDTAIFAGGKILVSYLKDAYSRAAVFGLDGKQVREVALPGIGSVVWAGAQQKETELFYSFTSFNTPAELYRYDLTSGESTLLRRSKLSFDPSQYETKQIFYTSKDGTKVPMFLVYRKGLKLDGQNPTILYGYGGFNIALTPAFNPVVIQWMEMGGVYAQANLRGGSEYGDAWHLAGTKLHKQNVFDDFIAAGEWLIANKYTSTPKLAISGGSNGGLLVGACLNQRPDLFGAAMPAVGVMDMLRFNKFTVGAGWVGDYGSPENPKEFQALRAYSPLHNIRKGVKYPAVLITTSDHDDRVVPGHSFKYAATLQAAQEGPAPILIRIETRAGHGAGKPTSKKIDEYADKWAFLVRALEMHPAGL